MITNDKRNSPVRAAAASMVGATLEWYDFYVYGVVATLVFPKLFFPANSEASGTLLMFATVGVGFLARPLGGIIFGHFGDKIGRKSMLILTLFLMGGASTLIGCLPTYGYAGGTATAMLVALRLIQGIAIGGEWGGAALMAVEHAPENRRGFFGSFVQIGASGGLLCATAMVTLVNAVTTDMQFMTWGWRIPFLMSAVVAVAGFMIRRGVTESPEFEREVKRKHTEDKSPLLRAFAKAPTAFVKIFAMRLAELVTSVMVTVFAINYGSTHFGIPRTSLLHATLFIGAIAVFLIPAMGALSDRIGRRPIYVIGALVGVVGAFPLFWALETQNIVLIGLAFILVANIGHNLVVSVQQPLFIEMFEPAFRYSGAGFAYQVASAITGGFTPLIAQFLVIQDNGGYRYVATFLAAACAISLATAIFYAGPRRKIHRFAT